MVYSFFVVIVLLPDRKKNSDWKGTVCSDEIESILIVCHVICDENDSKYKEQIKKRVECRDRPFSVVFDHIGDRKADRHDSGIKLNRESISCHSDCKYKYRVCPVKLQHFPQSKFFFYKFFFLEILYYGLLSRHHKRKTAVIIFTLQ